MKLLLLEMKEILKNKKVEVGLESLSEGRPRASHLLGIRNDLTYDGESC